VVWIHVASDKCDSVNTTANLGVISRSAEGRSASQEKKKNFALQSFKFTLSCEEACSCRRSIPGSLPARIMNTAGTVVIPATKKTQRRRKRQYLHGLITKKLHSDNWLGHTKWKTLLQMLCCYCCLWWARRPRVHWAMFVRYPDHVVMEQLTS
jgi:hypothetical protein